MKVKRSNNLFQEPNEEVRKKRDAVVKKIEDIMDYNLKAARQIYETHIRPLNA